MSLFQTLPRGALSTTLESCLRGPRNSLPSLTPRPELSDLASSLERLLTPLSLVTHGKVESLAEAFMRNLDEEESAELETRFGADASGVVADLLLMLSNSVHHLELPRRIVCQNMSDSLKQLFITLDESTEEDVHGFDTDGFFKIVTELIVERASPVKAADAWKKISVELSKLLQGCTDIVAAMTHREASLLGKGGGLVAEALEYPPRQVVRAAPSLILYVVLPKVFLGQGLRRDVGLRLGRGRQPHLEHL